MPVEENDPFEERFADALRHAGNTFETSSLDLAVRGEARGRRSAARRRIAVVGSVTAVALAGLGGTLVLHGGHGNGERQQSVAAGPNPPAAARTHRATVTGDELIGTLKKLLPEGKFSQEEGRGTDEPLPPYTTVVYDDGNGKAAVSVSLNRLWPGGRMAHQATPCPDRAYVAFDACTSTTLSDGSALTVMKGYEYPNRRSGTKVWRADLVTPAGQHVTVQEWNAPAEKDAPVSREQPPLSTAQLKALVGAQEWRNAVNTMPKPLAESDPDAGQGAPGGSVSSTLASLLPMGAEVVSRSGKDEWFGYVVLDDGKGASLVQVNVDLTKQDGDHTAPDGKDDRFGSGAKTLPDGTKVATRQGHGEKGGKGVVMWTVDTLRPDGRRVAISAFNSGAQYTASTRSAPVLTMAQLEAIATSTKWHPTR